MAEQKQYKEELKCPDGVKSSLVDNVLTVSGSKGEIKKKLVHPKVLVNVNDNVITLSTDKRTKTDKRIFGTFKSHIKNMLKGVKDGFECKLKICSGHFPMNVNVAGNEFIIKNFIGEKVPRKLKLSPEVKVKVEGDFITVEGNNKELVGQTAGSIEKLTRRSNFDRRVFQQGIYVTEKTK